MAEFCIGTAQFGMDYGIANTSGQPRQEEIDQIVASAVDNGIRFFDTAQSYGNSESFLGKALEKLEHKNSLRFVSKLSPDLHSSSSDIIIKTVKSSVQNLNIESLYGFLAHQLEAIYTQSFASAVQQLKNEEIIFKSGVSVYTPDEAKTALENPLVEILQIPLNILDRRWIDEMILKKAEEKNVQLFFRSIFLQGLIFLNAHDLKKVQMEWAHPYLDQFKTLVSETSLSLVELSINVLSNLSGDNIIIIGVDNYQQLQENINIISNLEPDKTFIQNWWSSIPAFPEKLLNPSLWPITK